MISLYTKLIGASLRSRMQYKVNFIFSSFSYALISGIDFLLLAAILYRFDDVKGWTLYEVGILYGIASAGIALYRLLAPEIHNFERYIIQGEFDSLLIRPVSPLLLLLSRNLDLGKIGGVAQGLLVIGISLVGLGKADRVTPMLLLYIPVAIIGGLCISFSLGLITATIAFWTQRIKDFQTFTLYAPFNAANYPMSIYPGWLKFIFFTVVPVAFVNYVPVVYLLGKDGSWINLFLAPVVALFILFVSYSFWKIGIRSYHSTGS
ncbi:MAG: ABC-2 family transporter protein [Bacilli bacterium]